MYKSFLKTIAKRFIPSILNPQSSILFSTLKQPLLASFFLSCSLLSISPSAFSYNLPSMGDPTQSILTAPQEQDLGKKFMQAVRSGLPLYNDPVVTAYIQQIGARLIAHSPRPSQHFYFFLVADPSINAFSGPDGFIAVNTGLILKTQKESELASVIAHESGHVIQRHIMRGFTEQKWLTLSSLAEILAGIAVSTQNPAAGAGIITSATAGSYQQALNYSRDFEREADNVGMLILANAGYDPCSMPAFFKLLAKEANLNGDKVPDLLRSHPVTEDRMADSENRCEQYHQHFEKGNNDELSLMKARLVVDFSHNPSNTVRKYEVLLKSSSKAHDPATHYGYALALAGAHQFSKALSEIDPLITSQPNQRLFPLAKAEIYERQGNYSEAIHLLEPLYKEYSHDFPIAMVYAHVLTLAKKNNQARLLLEPFEEKYSEDENYLFLLSQVQGFSKHLPEAYMTRAKIFMLYGDKKGAIQQLQLALESAPKNSFLKQRIKKKLEEIKGFARD